MNACVPIARANTVYPDILGTVVNSYGFCQEYHYALRRTIGSRIPSTD
jgi:hypothetical protein